MSEKLITSTVIVASALTGLATVAVLLSRNAKSSGVLDSLGSAFSGGLSCALSPILGGGGKCGTQTSSSISFK